MVKYILWCSVDCAFWILLKTQVDWPGHSVRQASRAQSLPKQSPQRGLRYDPTYAYVNNGLLPDEDSQDFDDLIFALKAGESTERAISGVNELTGRCKAATFAATIKQGFTQQLPTYLCREILVVNVTLQLHESLFSYVKKRLQRMKSEKLNWAHWQPLNGNRYALRICKLFAFA